MRCSALAHGLVLVAGHGLMTQPPSVTGPGADAGACNPLLQTGCAHMWYENGTMIPGEPTIDEYSPLRTTRNCRDDPKLCNLHDGPGNALCCIASKGLEPGNGIDTTRKAPWRAPGTASITSPCGIEGGNPRGCPAGNPFNGGCQSGGYGHGRDGRTLLEGGVVTEWTANSVVDVKFMMHNNHGGGYSYRLCKKTKDPMEMDEACFQQMPLDFVGNTSTVDYHSANKKDLVIPALTTTNGTFPAGSSWRKNPIPFCDWLSANPPSTFCPFGAQFKPPVKGTPEGYGPFFDWDLADQVKVPDVEGDFVLSWRWDCEEFYPGQVWTTCSNVRISRK